jgi:hypothetical protein
VYTRQLKSKVLRGLRERVEKKEMNRRAKVFSEIGLMLKVVRGLAINTLGLLVK